MLKIISSKLATIKITKFFVEAEKWFISNRLVTSVSTA